MMSFLPVEMDACFALRLTYAKGCIKCISRVDL